MYKQDAPFSIQVEMTKGCNLQCGFCGINGFQEKPNSNFEFMILGLAENLANQIEDSGWNSRIEFAMHGEPTMNEDWLDIIAIFRKVLPKHQLMMTTNGGGIIKSRDINGSVLSFFKNGGDILAIDEYQGVNFCNKIRKAIDEFQLDEEGISVYEYPRDKKGNPHQRTKSKFISFIAPIDISKEGVHFTLTNHCGSGGELDLSMSDKLCAKPFREISINWDGSINLCCNDFIGEFTTGNISEENLVDIWRGDRFNSVRKFLMNRERGSLRPCRGCNAKSHRVGLLPDKFGKITLDKPDDNDKRIVLEALQGGPDRKPTKRARENIIPILNIDEELEW